MLYRNITDCGAGGFSSAIGEMGEETGAEVYLEKAPLKYGGLKPWEIFLSESQERMILAVPPDRIESLRKLCLSEDVEATVIGSFTSDRRLKVTYKNIQDDTERTTVADLDMEFLHNGIPRIVRTARWDPPDYPEPAESDRLDPEESQLQRLHLAGIRGRGSPPDSAPQEPQATAAGFLLNPASCSPARQRSPRAVHD